MNSAEANLQTHVRSFHLVPVLLRYKLNYSAENGLPISGIDTHANKIQPVSGESGI
jgi:hypothetical protein